MNTLSLPAAVLGALVTCTLSAGAEEPQPQEVLVLGLPLRRDAFELKAGAPTARLAPGTQGDPLKVVETLPGVARAGLGSDALVVWGAGPEDTRSYVDGVEVPFLFHYAGLRSTLNAALVQDLALTPGAFGADFGRGIGGLMRVATSVLPADTWHAQLDLNSLDLSAEVSTALAADVRLAAAARLGIVDRLLTPLLANSGGFFSLPSYHDAQAKAEWAVGNQASLSVVMLDAHDTMLHTAGAPSSLQHRRDTRGFNRVYARYVRTLDDGSQIQVTPWVGTEQRALDAEFGPNPAALHEAAWRWGLRAEHRARLATILTLNLGVDLAGTHAALDRQGSLTIPAREGDPNIFGQPPGGDLNSDSWRTTSIDLGAYTDLDLRTGPLSVRPGLRFDGYLLETSRQTPRVGQTPAIGSSRFSPDLQPRVQAALALSPQVSVLVAAGVYSQPPAAADLSAVFGSPTLDRAQAQHLSLGESVQFSRELSLTTLGYFKAMQHLAVRDATPTPKLAQALTETGHGVSYGVQATLRQRAWHGFSGSLAAAVSRSERGAVGDSTRLFDYDQPLILTLIIEKALADWHFGARMRCASGNPRTPVIGALFNEHSAAYEPTLGPHNTVRLPIFWQLDARVDKVFALPGDARLVLQLEVLNVTNHPNAEEFSYSADYTERGIIRGLPLVATLGARLEL